MCPNRSAFRKYLYRFNESAETPSNSERIPCVVIDPANSHKVVEVLNQNNLHCTHILLTHGHFDHTMGVAELKSHENALVAIHEADAGALAGGKASLAYLGGALVKPCKVDIILHGGECFTAAGIEFSVLHTPGHTKGGVCYVIEKERVIFPATRFSVSAWEEPILTAVTMMHFTTPCSC